MSTSVGNKQTSSPLLLSLPNDDSIPLSTAPYPPLPFPPLSSSVSSLHTSIPCPSLSYTLPQPFVSTVSSPFQSPFVGTINTTSMSQYNPVAALVASNVANLVTIKLASVEDYLTWRTQFQSLLLSHELFGFVDNSIPPPNLFVHDASGIQQPNLLYRSWLRIDQSVRSWLFATLSREVLMDVHLLPTSRDIWNSLQRRYMDASKEYDTLVGIITHFPGVQFAQGGRGKGRSFNCKGRGRGHSALQCNNHFNHAFIANDLPKSFVAMFVGESNDATCYFDSVASTHMTLSEEYKGYRCLDPKSGRVYVSRHVMFHELIFPYPELSSSPVVSPSSITSNPLVVTSPLNHAPPTLQRAPCISTNLPFLHSASDLSHLSSSVTIDFTSDQISTTEPTLTSTSIGASCLISSSSPSLRASQPINFLIQPFLVSNAN
ncbi:hypothetical protein KY289_013567 [Solanum tuberosum]|nr:hypothetical protein KY289_013567 [Solanum tuberosum]